MLIFVIPVKTGIQSFQALYRFWIPAYAGMTIFYETIKDENLLGATQRRNRR